MLMRRGGRDEDFFHSLAPPHTLYRPRPLEEAKRSSQTPSTFAEVTTAHPGFPRFLAILIRPTASRTHLQRRLHLARLGRPSCLARQAFVPSPPIGTTPHVEPTTNFPLDSLNVVILPVRARRLGRQRLGRVQRLVVGHGARGPRGAAAVGGERSPTPGARQPRRRAVDLAVLWQEVGVLACVGRSVRLLVCTQADFRTAHSVRAVSQHRTREAVLARAAFDVCTSGMAIAARARVRDAGGRRIPRHVAYPGTPAPLLHTSAASSDSPVSMQGQQPSRRSPGSLKGMQGNGQQ